MDFELDPRDLRELQDLARESGKDPGTLLGKIVHDALAERKRNGGYEASHGESFLAAAARTGAVGCVKGAPRDVSCTPRYPAGLGED